MKLCYKCKIEKSHECFAKNQPQCKACDKQYRQNNKSRLNEYNKKYRKNKYDTDVNFRLKVIASASVSQFLRTQNLSKNNSSILDHLPFSIQELKEHLEKQFEPWMNWGNYGIYRANIWNDNDTNTWTWHIDHIIPQSLLSYTSMKDDNFKKCWSLDNLRPLAAKINVLEGNKRIL